MKAIFSHKSASFLAMAIVLSAVIVWSTSTGNVYACPPSPTLACTNPSKLQAGALNTTNYGYPVTYRKVVTFEPCHSTGQNTYCNVSKSSQIGNGNVSIINLAINVIFWFALFTMLDMFRTMSRLPKSKK